MNIKSSISRHNIWQYLFSQIENIFISKIPFCEELVYNPILEMEKFPREKYGISIKTLKVGGKKRVGLNNRCFVNQFEFTFG